MKHLYHMMHRVRTDDSGATLVEFAIVFPAFLVLIFSILEFSMIMFASSAISNAVIEAGRSGMTGSSYGHSADRGVSARKAYIEDTVNKRLGAFSNMGTMQISASPYGTVENVGLGGEDDGYGVGGQIVRYQINFDWKVLSPVTGVFLGFNYPIKATTLIKNESF